MSNLVQQTRQQVVDIQQHLLLFSNNSEHLNDAVKQLKLADAWLELCGDQAGLDSFIEIKDTPTDFSIQETEKWLHEFFSDIRAVIHYMQGVDWGQIRDNHVEVRHALQSLYQATFLVHFEIIRLFPTPKIEVLDPSINPVGFEEEE